VDKFLEALKALLSEVVNHAASANGVTVDDFDPSAEKVILAGTARKYRDAVCYAFHLLDEHDKDLGVYWALKGWNRRLQLAPVYADDPVTLGDLADEVFYAEELKPGEVIAFVVANEEELPVIGPYETDEENLAFFEGQRGGYYRDDDGSDPDSYDNFDLRDPEEGWAEYLEPVGMGEFYRLAEWQDLRDAMTRAIQYADQHGLVFGDKWDHVRQAIRYYLDELWEAATRLYLDDAVNSVAMGLIVHKLVSSTKFSREEMAELTKQLPGKSHVDGTPLGISLFRWMQDYREELDDILEDGSEPDWTPRFPEEEQRVADTWAGDFEAQLERHWIAQAKQRKPVEIEGDTKIWAGVWTGLGDVAYNRAYFQAVAAELSLSDVLQAARQAKARKRWIANELMVVSADERGVTLADNTFLRWNQAARQVKRITVPRGRKDGLLATMRRVYASANGDRPYIAKVGQVIKAL